MTRSPRILACGGLAALLTGAVLAAVPAPARAAGFTEAGVQVSASTSLWGGTCTKNAPSDSTNDGSPLVANGPAVTSSTTITADYSPADASDRITNTAALSARTALTTSGGLPRSLTTTFSGSVTTTSTKPVSACRVHATARVNAGAVVLLDRPTWVTLTSTSKGVGQVEAYLEDPDNGYRGIYSGNNDGTSSTRALLRPGTYGVSVSATAERGIDRAFSGRTSGSITIGFAPAGSAEAAPSGSGTAYVGLPAARSCATHGATARLTTSKKRVKQLRSVSFTVDGRKVATVKGKRLTPGRAVNLPVTDARPASITATAILKNGKKRTVTARYLACTG
ncbi:hypothetical protein ACFJIY_17850 [Pimelobacter simplex]|uniref:hypothetical protein n=1 Tax=Nocardioides simplex TaxID=2045 RepID=UPI00366B647D